MANGAQKSALFLGILALLAASYFVYTQRDYLFNIIPEADPSLVPFSRKHADKAPPLVIDTDSVNSLEKVQGPLATFKGGLKSVKRHFDNLQNNVSSISPRTRAIVGVIISIAILTAIIVPIVLAVQRQQLQQLQEAQLHEKESQAERLVNWVNASEPGIIGSAVSISHQVIFVIGLFVVFGILLIVLLSVVFYWERFLGWVGVVSQDVSEMPGTLKSGVKLFAQFIIGIWTAIVTFFTGCCLYRALKHIFVGGHPLTL